MWITVKWRPKRQFSFVRLRGLLSYGWKLLVSSLIDVGYVKLRQFIIGLKYSAADLAYFNKGDSFPYLIVYNLNSSIASVLFPVMSKRQDDRSQVRNILSKSIKTSNYIIAPLMIGLAAVAEPIIRLLLTDKWLPCVPYLRISCIAYILYPINTANLSAIKAVGRSDLFLKLEILKKTIGVAIVLIAMNISVMAMGYSLLVIGVIGQIINSWPNKKLLGYSYIMQIKDIMPSMLLSVFMGFVVYCVSLLKTSDWITILIQIPLGIVIYILGSIIFKIESFEYTRTTLGSFLNKK